MDFYMNKQVTNHNGDIFNIKNILKNADSVLFYFSASWCKKCTTFLPKLMRVYEEAKALHWGLDIISIPMDETPEEMIKHFATQGDWYSVDFDLSTCRELVFAFNVTYIPTCIVISRSGKIITKKGVEEIESIGINVLVTWAK